MKTSEISIGGVYLTRVSGILTRVRVLRELLPDGRFNKRKRFEIEREDNGARLKPRDPSALRQASPPRVRDPFEAMLRIRSAATLGIAVSFLLGGASSKDAIDPLDVLTGGPRPAGRERCGIIAEALRRPLSEVRATLEAASQGPMAELARRALDRLVE